MPLGRRLQARRVSSDFRALIDRGTARVQLDTVGANDVNGTIGGLTFGILQLRMHRRAGYPPVGYPPEHAWTQARVDLPFASREVLVQMWMLQLRPEQ